MKYTLDRIENDLYVFVEKGNENNELVLLADEILLKIEIGDIVNIITDGNGYSFELFKEETKARKEDVQGLIEKLKKK